jgi:hypothetical protein
MSASCERALVAAVARSECTHNPIQLGADAGLEPVFLDDVAVDRIGIERPVEFASDGVFYRTEKRTGGIVAMSGQRQVLLDPKRCAMACTGTKRILLRLPLIRKCITPSRLWISRTLKGVRDRAILATLLYQGIRREELFGLRVRSLLFILHNLLLLRSLTALPARRVGRGTVSVIASLV